MPKYTVYTHIDSLIETPVEADSPEQAMELVEGGEVALMRRSKAKL